MSREVVIALAVFFTCGLPGSTIICTGMNKAIDSTSYVFYGGEL